MADRRKPKQKRRQNEPEKPTKEEYAISKYLRFNVPIKEGKLMGMTVQYFKANKAVDGMLESKWAKQKEPLFVSRAGCVDYCNILLEKGMFHRALKVEKKKDKDKEKKKKKKDEVEDSPSVEKKKKKAKKEEEEEKKEEEDKEKEEEKKDDDKKKKKERKLRLEMHDNQVFKDGDEVYVWIYDPVPFKTFLMGLVLVLGAVGVCLFPLWPPEVRLGVYYLSLAAGGFVVFILSLCVIRMVLFSLVWAFTFGKHHFWLLPNLTEDVGFFDSFKPLYKYDYMDRSKAKEKEKSDAQKPDDTKEVKEEKAEEKQDTKEETASEGSNENGYEIVDAEDIKDDKEQDDIEGEEEEDLEPKKTK